MPFLFLEPQTFAIFRATTEMRYLVLYISLRYVKLYLLLQLNILYLFLQTPHEL
jgi:hypothetical protein